MKAVVAGVVLALFAMVVVGKPAPHIPVGMVSDWTHHHVLYPNPDSNHRPLLARIQRDPRWLQDWYLRHPETWWPARLRRPSLREKAIRDWNVSLSSSPATSAFEPLFNYAFAIGPDTGYGAVNTTDNDNGEFLATAGTLTVTGGQDIGSYPLYPDGPAEVDSPSAYFYVDNLLYPSVDPGIDNGGLLFVTSSDFEINIFSNGPDSYQFYDNTGYNNMGTIIHTQRRSGRRPDIPRQICVRRDGGSQLHE